LAVSRVMIRLWPRWEPTRFSMVPSVHGQRELFARVVLPSPYVAASPGSVTR
jgi:hypothetical protein